MTLRAWLDAWLTLWRWCHLAHILSSMAYALSIAAGTLLGVAIGYLIRKRTGEKTLHHRDTKSLS